MDETACFVKTLSEKGIAEKISQAKGGKASKTRLSIVFFVSAVGGKGIESLDIWGSVKPSCFKKVKNRKRPDGVDY